MTGKGTPTARLVRKSDALTRWLVKFPSTIKKDGAAYYVTTYPNSDLIFIETAVKPRQVSELVARRIAPLMRDAIKAAADAL